MNRTSSAQRAPAALRGLVRFLALLAALSAGWTFVQAGWEKWDDPAWTGARAGTAMTGFMRGANAKAIKSERNPHPDVLPFMRAFNEGVVAGHTRLFSWLVVLGELLVPVGVVGLLCMRFPGSRALLLGLTGLAAGMNFLYLHQGSAGVNPAMTFMWLTVLWLVALLPASALAYALDLRRLVTGAASVPAEPPDASLGSWVFFGLVLLVLVGGSLALHPVRTFVVVVLAGVGLVAIPALLNAQLAHRARRGRAPSV